MSTDFLPGGSWLLKCLGSLSRASKRAISVAVDTLLITMAYWGAYWIRLEHSWPIASPRHWALLCAIIVLSISVFVRLGLYRAILRYVREGANKSYGTRAFTGNPLILND